MDQFAGAQFLQTQQCKRFKYQSAKTINTVFRGQIYDLAAILKNESLLESIAL